MEYPIIASNINDFIFCPVSIYFHNLYGNQDTLTYQHIEQINGTNVHKNIDDGVYSTSKHILSRIEVYSEKYNILSKIDLFDTKKGILTERKKKINMLFDGQIFQVYAQYFALRELGYSVNKIRIHSIDDNKNYDLPLPEDDRELLDKFERTIKAMNEFDFQDFEQTNSLKCVKCIYESSCSKSIKENNI